MEQVKPGEHYHCIDCARCGHVLVLAHDKTRGVQKFYGAGKLRMTCSNCGAEHDYPATDFRSKVLIPTH